MSPKTILVTGASGVLGWHLYRYFSGRDYTVIGNYGSHRPVLGGARFDHMPLEKPDRIAEYLDRQEFELVIHSAAVTSPDDCEKDPDHARKVNLDATEQIARSLPDQTFLAYISTDLVFDGKKGNYSEKDEPNPVNYYGETKLAAEESVRKRSNSAVFRVAKLYSTEGPFRASFESWMRDRFIQGLEIPLFEDQFRTPLFVGDAARALECLLETKAEKNLYHLGGPRRISRLEFGQTFAGIFGYDSSLIKPTRASDLGLVVRGQDCSLDSTRFCEEFGFKRSSLEEGFLKMKNDSY